MLVAGGVFDYAQGALVEAELYDPATNTWSAAASLSGWHQDHTATLLASGKVLVTAGRFNADAELYL